MTPADLSDRRDLASCQYPTRDQLDAYSGMDLFIDMHAFTGTRDELAAMTIQ